jgi:hypothetical protein
MQFQECERERGCGYGQVPGSANQWSMPDLRRALLEPELQANGKIPLKATKTDGDWVYCMHGSFFGEFNHSERRVRGYLPCLNCTRMNKGSEGECGCGHLLGSTKLTDYKILVLARRSLPDNCHPRAASGPFEVAYIFYLRKR